MSKSRGNAIALRDDEDRTAALVRQARTDSERMITYDPVSRPGVAGLLLTAALCSGRDPVELAAEIGSAGAAALKPAPRRPSTSTSGRSAGVAPSSPATVGCLTG